MSLPRTFENLSMAPYQVPTSMQEAFASFVDSNSSLKETRFLPPSRNFLFDGIEILINGDKPSNEQKAKQALREFFNVENIIGKNASSRDYEKFLIFWNPAAFKKLFEALNNYDPAMTLNIIKDENNNVSVQLHVNLHDKKGRVVEQCDWSFKFDADNGFTAGNLHCNSMVFHELLKKQSVVNITEEDIRESTKESLRFLADNDFLHAASKELDESAWTRFIAEITRSDKLVFGNPPFGNTPETSAIFRKSAEYKNYKKLIADAAAKGNGLEKNSQEYLKDAVNSFIQRRFGKEALTTFHETVIPHYNQNPSVTPASALLAGLETASFMKTTDSDKFVGVGRKLGTGTTAQRIFYNSTTQQFHYQNTTSDLVFTNTSEPPTEVPLTDVSIHSECYYDKKGSHFLPEKITGPAEMVEFTKELYLGSATAFPTKKAVKNLEDSVSASDSSSTASTSSSNSADVRKKAPTIVVEITPPSSPRRRPVQSVPETLEDDVLKEDEPYQQTVSQPKEGFFKRAIKNPYVIAALVFLAVAITLTAIALITLGTAGTGALPALVATGIGATAFGSTTVGAAIVSTLTAAAATIAGTVGATIGLIAGPFLVAYGVFASGLAVFRRFATSKPLELKNAMGGNSNNVITDALEIKHDAETPKPSSSLANAPRISEQEETFKFNLHKGNASKPAAVDANQQIIEQLLKAFTYTRHWHAKKDMSKNRYEALKLPTKYHPAKSGELGGAKNKLAEEFKRELQKLATDKNLSQENLIKQCRELLNKYKEQSNNIRTHTEVKITPPRTNIDYPSSGVEQEVHTTNGEMVTKQKTTGAGRLEKNFDKLDNLLKELEDQYSSTNIPRMD